MPFPRPVEGGGRSARSDCFWLIVLAIALAASLFRFAIARYSLWFDEQASLFFAAQPLTRLWSGWMLREPNPPLYYTLLKIWIGAFGDSARAVRSLSIAAGAGSIVATAVLTRQIYDRRAGIVAAGLVALCAQQLYYSLQARSYELVYLAACVSTIGLVSIERAWRLGRAWTGSLLIYAAGCTACIYLHTTMFLLPVIDTLVLVLVRRREVADRPMLLLALMVANLAIAAGSGWWLEITVQQLGAGAENSAVFDRVTPWLVISKTIGVLTFAEQTGAARTLIAIIATVITVCQLQRSWVQPETRLLLAILGIGVMLTSLISVAVPIFLPRTIYWLSAISTVLCAGWIGRQLGRSWAVYGLGSLIALNTATAIAARQTEDWDGAISRAERVPGSRLIVQSEAMGLLLATACARSHHGSCPVPIIAVTTPGDRLDRWSAGLYTGRAIAIDHIAALPSGRYFVFRKEYYHDLLSTLHQHGKARLISGDPALLGPVDRAALIF